MLLDLINNNIEFYCVFLNNNYLKHLSSVNNQFILNIPTLINKISKYYYIVSYHQYIIINKLNVSITDVGFTLYWILMYYCLRNITIKYCCKYVDIISIKYVLQFQTNIIVVYIQYVINIAIVLIKIPQNQQELKITELFVYYFNGFRYFELNMGFKFSSKTDSSCPGLGLVI